MRSYLLGFFICFYSTSTVLAQDSLSRYPKNALHVELGGQGLVYSLIYERVVLSDQNLTSSFQIGVSIFPNQTRISEFWFPIMFNQTLRISKGHYVELSGGGILSRKAIRDFDIEAVEWFWGIMGPFRIGYRFNRKDSPVVFRLGLTPILHSQTSKLKKQISPKPFNSLPFAGISFGYLF